ncbi:MAG: GNAT family N-acetyltransferase [bacterium]|nr:GNAT family N-acetyltransferase [bacterium]
MLDSLETPTTKTGGPFTFSCLRADELTSDHWAAWSAIQQSDPRLGSPFFRPEFTQLVETHQGGVEVAIIKRNDGIVGFFPFQRSCDSVGRPMGAPLSDFQGPILAVDADFSLYELLYACGLKSWRFDHLLAQYATAETGCCRRDESPYLDLSNGFDAYQSRIAEQGSSVLKKSRQYSRKVERDIGPIRWVWRDETETAFDCLDQWKSLLFEQMGARNIFRIDWVHSLLRGLLDHDTPEFSGMLTSLYAGDELLAVHLGIQSGSVLHWWLPTYNPNFARYSAGTILLTEAAARSHERGIERIDLGKGPESYKKRYATGATPICEGAIDTNVISRTLRSGWHLTRTTLEQNSWGTTPLSCYRKLRDWWCQQST